VEIRFGSPIYKFEGKLAIRPINS